jgi:hypothetical protein
MFEKSESTINEMTAGDGSGLALPPSFVFVNTKKRRVLKRKDDKVDGRKKSARKLIKRILNSRLKRKGKMSEENITLVNEATSDTEKAQKQIKASKDLRAKKELQKKRGEAKEKMQDKQGEMQTLLKARMSDFRKKATEKQQKAQKQVSTQKNSFEPSGEVISEANPNTAVLPGDPTDVFSQAYKIAQEGTGYGRDPEISFAHVRFQDGSGAQMSVFDAQKIVAAYEGLTDENRTKFCALLNMNATTYANALQFAQYNV